MIKKMTLLAMVVGALAAFAAPGTAGAAQLTNEGGGLVSVGTTLVGTSTNTVMSVGGLTVTCTVTINGVVTENTGGASGIGKVAVKMDEPSKDSASKCTIHQIGAVTVVPTFTGLSAAGTTAETKGTAFFDFSVSTAAGPLCSANTKNLPSLMWTAAGADTVEIVAALEGTCGTGTLTGTFTLETTAGKKIIAEN